MKGRVLVAVSSQGPVPLGQESLSSPKTWQPPPAPGTKAPPHYQGTPHFPFHTFAQQTGPRRSKPTLHPLQGAPLRLLPPLTALMALSQAGQGGHTLPRGTEAGVRGRFPVALRPANTAPPRSHYPPPAPTAPLRRQGLRRRGGGARPGRLRPPRRGRT